MFELNHLQLPAEQMINLTLVARRVKLTADQFAWLIQHEKLHQHFWEIYKEGHNEVD